jgi:glyoxylase-like metal-dependent hydrolase (beta-lactamase superfamily II)
MSFIYTLPAMKTWETGTIEVAPNAFAYVQAIGGFCIANAGILGGGGAGSTVIDALFTPSMTRALLDESRRVAPGPIARLLSTHHHVDHTLGNALFPRDTEILSHARAKAEMERVGIGVLGIIKRMAPHFEDELQGIDERGWRLPDATFDGDTLEIEAGGRRVRLLHFGTGHTRGDVMVHLPEDRVLFLGDVGFFYVTPLAFEGHIGNWINVCDRVIAEVDADVLVPGHGPAATKDDLRLMRDYLALVHTASKQAYDAGVSEQEATPSIDLGEYAEWGESERLPINVARCYTEFRGEIRSDRR